MRQLARAMRRSGTIAEFDLSAPPTASYGELPFPKASPVRFGSTRAGVRPNYGISGAKITTFGNITSGVKTGLAGKGVGTQLALSAGKGVASAGSKVVSAGSNYLAKTRYGAQPGQSGPPPLEVPEWGELDEPPAPAFPPSWDAPSGMSGAKKTSIARPKKSKTSVEGEQLDLPF
jgi:hypothetical protein